MKKTILFIIILIGLSSCSDSKKSKSIHNIKLMDSIDSVLDESQIVKYDEDRDPWYGKEKKYSFVNIPARSKIFFNKFEFVQLLYDNQSRKIHHKVYVKGVKNFDKCLEFRKNEKSNFFESSNLNEDNIEMIKPFKHTDVFQHLTDSNSYKLIKDKSILSFSCIDYTKSIMKPKPSNNFEYRFEYISETFNIWLIKRDKEEKRKKK